MGRKKKTKTSKRYIEYTTKYIKENYKRREIRLKKEDDEKLVKVLDAKNQVLKDYVMEKVNADLKTE